MTLQNPNNNNKKLSKFDTALAYIILLMIAMYLFNKLISFILILLR